MGYALIILDENGFLVLKHVANSSEDSIYVEDWNLYGMPVSDWRKAHHLTNWVGENKPEWKVKSTSFDIETVFPKEAAK